MQKAATTEGAARTDSAERRSTELESDRAESARDGGRIRRAAAAVEAGYLLSVRAG